MHTGKERAESATMRQHCFISEGKYLIINDVWAQKKPWSSLETGEGMREIGQLVDIIQYKNRWRPKLSHIQQPTETFVLYDTRI